MLTALVFLKISSKWQRARSILYKISKRQIGKNPHIFLVCAVYCYLSTDALSHGIPRALQRWSRETLGNTAIHSV
jgi:hypothetical protein